MVANTRSLNNKKEKVKWIYNNKVWLKSFKEGDLV